MLRWAIAFFIIALIAALLPGMGWLSGTAANIGYFLAVLFLILFVISLIVGRGAAPPV
jgi:uncharacterized membrane protein YtjA (UPF0391 family)